MPEGRNSPELVSIAELTRLSELFLRFEGAATPYAPDAREARAEFDRLVENIYRERVYPVHKDQITSITFYSLVRNQCRVILSRRPPTSF
jgi:hypothetical protein